MTRAPDESRAANKRARVMRHRRENFLASAALEGLVLSAEQRERLERSDRAGLTPEQRLDELRRLHAR